MDKRINNILPVALLMSAWITSDAAPARPGVVMMTGSEGVPVEVILHGDEHFNYMTTPDGALLEMAADGTVCAASEISKADFSRRKIMAERRTRRKPLNPEEVPTRGTTRGLVILAEYSDISFSASTGKEAFENLLNQPGYNYKGATGSVSDYYRDQSYGLFTPEFDVVGPVKLPSTMSYYGADAQGATDPNAYRMIVDACEAADGIVDFSKYDNDGDGSVDLVYVIYSGYAQSNGASSATIWPHMYWLRENDAVLNLDGVEIDRYACSAELTDKTGDEITGIGLICHEFSHTLGLPDIYDPLYQSPLIAMGEWDVMDIGCYNNNMRTPAGYSAYEKKVLGWIDPVELTGVMSGVTLPSLGSEGKAFKMTSSADPDEYFMLETRSRGDKWDSYLPGEGMLIVKVKYDRRSWEDNQVNSCGNRGVHLIPANGDFTNSTEGESTPFPGSSNVTVWSDMTEPSSIFSDGSYLERAVTNIDFDGKVVSFDLGETLGSPVMTAPTDVTDTGFRINWERVDEATHYMVRITSEKTGESTVYSKIVRNRFTFSDMDYNDTYTCCVRATNETLLSPWSEEISICLSEMAETAVVDNRDFMIRHIPEGIVIYAPVTAEIMITDTTGKTVEMFRSSGYDEIRLSKGVYVIRCRDEIHKVII